MKKIIVTILTLLMALSMAGCVICDQTEDEISETGSRFKSVYVQSNAIYTIHIVKDTDTGENYLMVSNGDGVGVCKLEDGENDE